MTKTPPSRDGVHNPEYQGFNMQGSNMNDTEIKPMNNGSHSAEPSQAWQSSGRAVGALGYLEPAVDLSLRSSRKEAEIHAINCALEQTGWNRKRAAKLLSVSYRCLLYKIRQHNITPLVGHS